MMKKLISLVVLAAILLAIPVSGNAAIGRAYAESSAISESELTAQLSRNGTIILGSYEQDGIRENGPEPIEWELLMGDAYHALLITRYGLEPIQYQDGYVDVTWETCELRPWMNDTFLNSAFTEEERAVIVPVTLDNSNEFESSTMWRTIKAENDTTDSVFALSCMQAEDLFGHRRGYSGGSNQTVLQGNGICKPTKYATSHGAKTDDRGNCYWWLRSPAVTTFYSSYVSPLGQEGATHIFAKHICARPAIWVDVKLMRELVQVGNDSTTSVSESGRLEVVDYRVEKTDTNNTLTGGYNYYEVFVTIRNASEETLELISPDMVFVNADGTIVYHQGPTESSRVRGGQSTVLSGSCELTLEPVAVYIDNYTYSVNGEFCKDYVDDPFVYALE